MDFPVELTSGDLVLEDGSRWGPTATLDAFRGSALASLAKRNTHAFYTAGPVRTASGQEILLSFMFGELSLASIGIVRCHGQAGVERSWDTVAQTWDTDLRNHREWLQQALGATSRAFDWGDISVVEDTLTGEVSILIRYGAAETKRSGRWTSGVRSRNPD